MWSVLESSKNRAQRDRERSPPSPPPPADTAYATSARSERTALKPLGQTQARAKKTKQKKPFPAIIQPTKSKRGFSSGGPPGISVVHFNPFCCLAFLSSNLKLNSLGLLQRSSIISPRGQFSQSLFSRSQNLLSGPLSGWLATRRGLHLWQHSSQEYGIFQGKGGDIPRPGAKPSSAQCTQDPNPKRDQV